MQQTPSLVITPSVIYHYTNFHVFLITFNVLLFEKFKTNWSHWAAKNNMCNRTSSNCTCTWIITCLLQLDSVSGCAATSSPQSAKSNVLASVQYPFQSIHGYWRQQKIHSWIHKEKECPRAFEIKATWSKNMVSSPHQNIHRSTSHACFPPHKHCIVYCHKVYILPANKVLVCSYDIFATVDMALSEWLMFAAVRSLLPKHVNIVKWHR